MCLYVYIEKNMMHTCWHPKFKKGKPKSVVEPHWTKRAIAPKIFQKKNITCIY